VAGQQSKDANQKTDVDNPVIYLVSAALVKDQDSGELKLGAFKPINDVFIGLQQDANVAKELMIDGGDVKQKAKFDANTQVYLTNSVGAICNFETGKTITDPSKFSEAFKTSGSINPFEKEAKLFFPPQHLVQFSLATQGLEGWIDDLRDSLKTVSDAAKSTPDWMEVTPQKVSVKDGFIDPDKVSEKELKCSGAYRKWYASEMKDLKTTPDKQILVLPMVRTRAVLVSFPDDRYVGAKVEVQTRKGKPAFLSSIKDAAVNIDLAKRENQEVLDLILSEVKAIEGPDGNTIGHGAVFYDVNGVHENAKSVEDQIYQVKVNLPKKNGKNKLGTELASYTLMERIRFPIETPHGQFDVINGDAISLEETLVKQFPIHYKRIIEQASASRTAAGDIQPPEPIKGMESYQFNLMQTIERTKLAGDVLSGTTMMGLRKLGTAVWNGIDGEWNLLRDSVNLAFSVYDTANKLPELLNQTVGAVQVGNQAADLLSDVPSTQSLPPSLSQSLDNYIAEQAARHPLPDNILKIARKAGKAIDAVGPVLDGVKVFNNAATLATNWKDLDTTVGQYKSIINDYAHKVLVVSNEGLETFSKEEEQAERDKIEEFIKTDPNGHIIKEYGDGYIINARFQFDKSKFVSDKSFDDLIELLNSINNDRIWLTIEGHTCDLGTDEYNLKLGQRRANAVGKAIREGLGDSKIIIDPVSRGESDPLVPNSSESNRAKNRRVYAYFRFNRINQYVPSREGIAHIERLRSLTTLQRSQLPDQLKQTVLSLMDCVAGVPPLNPAHAAFSVLWMVGNLLVDAATFIDKAIHGETLINQLKDFDSQKNSSATNQLLFMKAPDGNKTLSVTEYFDGQFRLRAEAINGLMSLLMRCSIEKSGDAIERHDGGKFWDDPRFGWYDSNFGRYKDGFSYQDNIEIYEVRKYVERFILNDGWQLNVNPIFPMSLDNYWIYLLRTGQVDVEPPLPTDANFFDKAIDTVSNWKDQVVDIAVSADDYTDQFKELSKNLINGCDYIYSNYKAKANPDRTDLLTANFQKLFPVHYLGADTFEGFAAEFTPDFSSLNEKSIVLNTLSARPRGSRGDGGWISFGKYLGSNNQVSPFDQVRVLVVLDPNEVAYLIENQQITAVPIEAYPVRVDGLNMEGPSVTGTIRKLSLSELTKDERTMLDNLENPIKEEDLYGAILVPNFMLGANVVYGTKPMANLFSAFLNVTDEHTLRSIFNWDHTWSMDYEYEVMLAGLSNAKSTCGYTKYVDVGRHRGQARNLTEFSLELRAEDKPGNTKHKDEGIFLDRHFLRIGKERESFPPLFDDPECYTLLQVNGEGAFSFSHENWVGAGKADIDDNDRLKLNQFNWHRKQKLAVLIVCDELDVEAYKKRNISYRNIPGMIQLYRKGYNFGELGASIDPMAQAFSAGTMENSAPFKGPTYEVSFKEAGLIELDASNELAFKWADHIEQENLDESYNLLGKALANKKNLSVLSGLKEALPDDSMFDQFMSGFKDKTKHLYVAMIDLDYQNMSGLMVEGLKPFKVFATTEDDIKPDWRWNLQAKVTTQGDSGLTNDNSAGAFSLPYPKGLFDTDSRWYRVSEKKKSEALKDIKDNERIVEDNKSAKPDQRLPLHISPLIKWLSWKEDNEEDELQKAIHNWLNKQATSRFLSYSKNRVMEGEDDVEKAEEKAVN